MKKGCSLLLLLPLLLPLLPGGRLNGRNPRLLAPEAERFNDRRTHRPHRSPARAPEERPILRQANSKPLSDSRGEATTEVAPHIVYRLQERERLCQKAIWAKVRRMRTVNLLPAVLLLQLLLSRRLAGRFWVKCYPGRYPRASLSNVTLDAHVICRPGIALLTGKGRRT